MRINLLQVGRITPRDDDDARVAGRSGANLIPVVRRATNNAYIGMRLQYARNHVLKHPRQISKQDRGEGQVVCSVRLSSLHIDRNRGYAPWIGREMRLSGAPAKPTGDNGRDRQLHAASQGLGSGLSHGAWVVGCGTSTVDARTKDADR